MSISLCPYFRMYLCHYVPLFLCPYTPMFLCAYIPMPLCSLVPKCSYLMSLYFYVLIFHVFFVAAKKTLNAL